jgi:hypothetical protein
MSNPINIDIVDLVKIIQQGELSSMEIMEKYNLSTYRFYKILHEYGIETKKKIKSGAKPGAIGNKRPKNTKFKQLLYGTEEEQKASKIFPESLVIEDFIIDSKNGMTIVDLMSKYNLTLYQIRELRKQHDLIKPLSKKNKM